jgi:hypothetical protein
MTIRLKWNGDDIGRKFIYGVKRWPERAEKAAAATVRDVADNIKEAGDQDIQSAGRFGSRWTDSFHADVAGSSSKMTVNVFSTISYFSVFEYGATIKGQPLLWIPLSFSNAVGIRARDYGPLFRVDRKSGGAPLLLSYDDRQPKYSGHESVNIPQKFHIRQICRSEAGQIPSIYRTYFERSK